MQLNPFATLLQIIQIKSLLMLSLLGGAAMLMSNTLAAHAQGSLAVRAWGSDSTGQIGDGNDKAQYLPVPSHTLADVRAVSAGWQHNLALKADGAVWAWGSNYACQAGKKDALYLTLPAKVEGIANIQAIAAGGSHSLALKADGTVWAWGRNVWGELGTGTRNLARVAVRQVSKIEGVNNRNIRYLHT